MSTAKELLSRSPLFQGESEATVKKFLDCAQTVRFCAGDIPVAETTVTDRILMVVDGKVRLGVELQAPDQEMQFICAGPGTMLGLVNFFGKVSQPLTATALTDTETVTWTADEWRRLCEADPAFGYRLSQRIGRELVNRMSNWINQILNSASWGF